MSVRRILKNINVMNVLLFTLITVLVCLDLVDYFNLNIKIALPKAASDASDQTEAQASFQSPPMSDFVIVGEQNVFHPERRLSLDKAGDSGARPEIVLYGTLVLGDTAIAYIEDKKNPYSTPGRGKRQKAVKRGESVNGYVLKEVGKDMIVLERGEDKMTVSLQDKKDRKQNEAITKTDTARPVPPSVGQPHQQAPPQPTARPAVPFIMPPPRR